jgi:hypothetical protein
MVAALVLAVVSWSLPLDGPWKFHTGDDMQWASPLYDDRAWATQDLAAPASANDGDQGITHFAPGWAAQGFPEYAGFAWYRLRVADPRLVQGEVAILGPAMVDSAYQIFVNGRLLGGIGDFSSATPIAYGIHPKRFVIASVDGSALVAVRVWLNPRAAGPRSGGMRVAPIIGDVSGVDAAYHFQWFEKIRAFALEITQAALFVALAIVTLLLPAKGNRRGQVALAVALILTAAERANLAFVWCLEIESVPMFGIIHSSLLAPLTLGAWMIAWTYWLQLRHRSIVYASIALTAVYILAKFFSAPAVVRWDRYAFVALLIVIVYLGLRERRTATLFALPAIILTAAGQFGSEIASLGVPSIWFPFGMGVSLANYAYLLSNVAIAGMLYEAFHGKAIDHSSRRWRVS